jgi:hypothetical protein
MRISRTLGVALTLGLAACSSSSKIGPDEDYFPSLQACFDEHTQSEGLTPQQAVVTCCIDHPIGDTKDTAVHPSCGMSSDDCAAHVHANLTTLAMSDVDAACQTYVEQLAK